MNWVRIKDAQAVDEEEGQRGGVTAQPAAPAAAAAPAARHAQQSTPLAQGALIILHQSC